MLGITDAIIPILSLESGISRGFASFDSSEKRPEGKVHPVHHILKNLRMNVFEFGFGFFPNRQHLLGFKIANRFAFLLKDILPHGKCFIVDPPAKL